MFSESQRESVLMVSSPDLQSFHYRPDRFSEPDVLEGCPTFDFEGLHGMAGWTYGGEAFRYQPTYQDTKFMREKIRLTGIEGDWWVSTHEYRPSSSEPMRLQALGYKGWALSPVFTINVTKYTFLIGGEGPRVGIQLIIFYKVCKIFSPIIWQQFFLFI